MYNISEADIYLFHQGTQYQSHLLLGCHRIVYEEQEGFRFGVWAPNAHDIRVVGDFNNWDSSSHTLTKFTEQGLWFGFFTDVPIHSPYKYEIVQATGEVTLKADPYAFQSEVRPSTASITARKSSYVWGDKIWEDRKRQMNMIRSPLSIYEVHLGSWKKKSDGEFLTYRELADQLVPYVNSLEFTHIELLPLSEHPFDLSWGYQITGYFSVTTRYGTAEDFKYFVDQCHQHNIGVIMDWVPGHFCKDNHGLRLFDGTPLYEYADPHKSEKPSWGTLTFDFGRPEVQSFLISNALFWLQEFHIDGLRVDAVESMLNLNFDRNGHDEKILNSFGGEENLEALAFIRKLNQVVFDYDPKVLMMAEDSSNLPLVTSPTYIGGLGFTFKWNMGWMNDVLDYMEIDPLYRKWNHELLTFSIMYTHTENFILPLSHDEVVHGKKSLLDKMPGDQWQKFAGFRLLYGYLMTHPGKKLMFMGGEFGQYSEWKDKEQLDWHLLDYPLHASTLHYVKTINHFYKTQTSLYELDHEQEGFEWIDPNNTDQSIIVYRRRSTTDELIIICNFTTNVYYDYKIGVPFPGRYTEIFNSDAAEFSGSNQLNAGQHFSFPTKWHGLKQHIKIKIPPLAISVFRYIEKDQINEEGKS
ncbi:1,4-alpha-glucan branching protein GlgB [Bacillus solitudinis]|uniref:1,4-alpha-glucan branching protein GlgB n=1 Tax=Bacillus solitudinis TaxID=2014074 RepID=UPI000C248B42|nr:1,4-alpha-glucan branching protein GlgB [Bacillus solitudinis]